MEEKDKGNKPNRPGMRMLVSGIGLLLSLLFFVYMVLINVGAQLNDPDIFWHLKTGEYILETHSLPDKDPFSFTTPVVLSENQKMGLRAQWLGQVGMYAAYKIASYPGLIIARNIMIILPMLILFAWLIGRGAGALEAFLVIAMPAMMFSIYLFYSFERPQGFSFILSTALILFLERLKKTSRLGAETKTKFDHAYWLVPLCMALWANLHAGYIVGNLIIVIYISSEAAMFGVRKFRGKGAELSMRPAFYVVCAASLAATCLNPNTYHIFFNYFRGILGLVYTDISQAVAGKGGGDWVRDVVLEYKSLYYFYKNMGYDWLVFYWGFTAFLYISMLVKYWLRRSFDMAEFLTVTFIVAFANTYARGLMFSLAVMPAYMGGTFMEIKEAVATKPANEAPPQAIKKIGRIPAILASLMLAATIAFAGYNYYKTPAVFHPETPKSWISPWYPSGMVRFILQNEIKPPMYNYYTWGGYMIWTMHPKYKVFMDGRAIDGFMVRTADSILKTYPGWMDKLDAFNINFIAVPVVFRESGDVIPLAHGLIGSPEWKLVYVKANAAVFVRDATQNRQIINQYEMDKSSVYKEIIDVENVLLSFSPGNPTSNIAKADALAALGRFSEAIEIYERFPELSQQRLKALGK